jgi:hypothetical protein
MKIFPDRWPNTYYYLVGPDILDQLTCGYLNLNVKLLAGAKSDSLCAKDRVGSIAFYFIEIKPM